MPLTPPKRTREEGATEALIEVVRLAAPGLDSHELMRSVLEHVKTWVGCQAAGIRLKENGDYPYFEVQGSPAKFVELERTLCATPLDGSRLRVAAESAVLECSSEVAFVEVDPHQFERVLMNLAANARDAMPAGGSLAIEIVGAPKGEVPVGADCALVGEEWAMLLVSDTGIGMDEETVRHVFEPFFTTKGAGRRTGLGLSTVFGIVKQSGGEIAVESEPGRGTTFRIYLPRVAAVPPHSIASSAGKVRRKTQGGEVVLVVEDEPAVQRLAARVLSDNGYTVMVAADGAQALALAEGAESDIDLLLTDVVLPGGMTGDEVAQSILAARPRTKVLYMSGYPRGAIVRDGRLGEGINYLEKLFTANGLLGQVREVLDD